MDLYEMTRQRQRYPQDQAWQDSLGPLEHRDFMEETTSRSPLLGTLLAGWLPFYTAMKAAGVNVGGTGEMKTSSPSLEEILKGWEGYRRGLARLPEE